MLSGFTGKVIKVYRDEVVLQFEDLEDPITFRKEELIPGGD